MSKVARIEFSIITGVDSSPERAIRAPEGRARHPDVFLNNTNPLIAERQPLPDRNALAANAKAMIVRSQIVRDAARKLRTTESA